MFGPTVDHSASGLPDDVEKLLRERRFHTVPALVALECSTCALAAYLAAEVYVWHYRFEQLGLNRESRLQAPYPFMETLYTFGAWDDHEYQRWWEELVRAAKRSGRTLYARGRDDARISQAIGRLWVNFARFGNPNGPPDVAGGQDWEMYGQRGYCAYFRGGSLRLWVPEPVPASFYPTCGKDVPKDLLGYGLLPGSLLASGLQETAEAAAAAATAGSWRSPARASRFSSSSSSAGSRPRGGTDPRGPTAGSPGPCSAG